MDGVCVVVVLCNNKEKREGKGERPTGFGNKYIGEHQWTVALWYLELWVAERRRQSRLRLVSDQGKELSQLLLQVSLFVKTLRSCYRLRVGGTAGRLLLAQRC